MGTERTESVMEKMAYRYNQLYLTPQKGISGTGLYYDIVRYGKVPPEVHSIIKNEGLSGFSCSDKDKFFSETTPAGRVDIIYIHERSDFERFLQIMAYSCEPAKVSPAIESAEILGVTNWRRIENHMSEYINNGGDTCSWRDELRRFKNDRKNYQDSLIVLWNSGYCGLTGKDVKMSEEIWEDVSLKIKIYSSCARFIYRRLFSEYKNIIWEEMLADCIGILFAFNTYDVVLAKKIFGVSSKGYDRRGKLLNHIDVSEGDVDKIAIRLSEAIDKLGIQVKKLISSGITDYYDVLFKLEEDMKIYTSILKTK